MGSVSASGAGLSMQVIGEQAGLECSSTIVRMATTSHNTENVSVTGIRHQVMSVGEAGSGEYPAAVHQNISEVTTHSRNSWL